MRKEMKTRRSVRVVGQKSSAIVPGQWFGPMRYGGMCIVPYNAGSVSIDQIRTIDVHSLQSIQQYDPFRHRPRD
jgi:hypothetical protein